MRTQQGYLRIRFNLLFPSKDAKRGFAAFHKRKAKIIKLLTVREILDEGRVQNA